MERRNSSSNFFSSLNHDSNFNNPIDLEENVDSVNDSGHGNHSSSIGRMDQSSFVGSFDNPIDLEEYNTEHGWVPSVPPILPLLEQFIPEHRRARLVHHALQIQRWAHGATSHFQELLVLEEQIGVNTGLSEEAVLAFEEQIGVDTRLSEEAVLGNIKPHRYQSMKLGLPVEEESCCVCLDKHVDGEELGKLDCGHEFHFNCIKTWLMEKNSCPICRKVALAI